jgi:hypothetical protein
LNGRRLFLLAAILSASINVPGALSAQDSNFVHRVDYILERLKAPGLDVLGMEQTRHLATDRSRRVTLGGVNGEPDMEVHWKPVGHHGQGFNNEPRYELAAWEFQKLFLDEDEYVVAPTVLRAMALEEYRRLLASAENTMNGTRSVLFLLSYWIQNLAVDTIEPFVPAQMEWDSLYARHWANLNIFTHLIDHKDSNHGNVLVSIDGMNRRVFSVDNDVAFRSRVSERGDRWRTLQVERVPSRTIERLRAITRATLEEKLAVLAEFEIVDGYLHPVEPGTNLDAGRGVRTAGDRIQFGLTYREIEEVERRIQRLLQRVDRGRLTTF